jgi:predicted transcriptional regulator
MGKVAMQRVVRVRDVMTEAVVLLRSDHTLDEAWAVLRQHRIAGAPVLDTKGRLVGVLSRADLADPQWQERWDTTVGEAMTHLVYAVRADDPITHAIRLMLDHDVHRAVVVNADGSLAGIVAPTDVLRAILRGDLGAHAEERGIEYVDLRKLRP